MRKRERERDLDEEALGRANACLYAQRKNAVHDLLLVSGHLDANHRQVLRAESGQHRQVDDACVLKVHLIARHLDAVQPLVDSLELNHIRYGHRLLLLVVLLQLLLLHVRVQTKHTEDSQIRHSIDHT